MTAKELYESAKALMFEKKSSRDYDNYYIPWINALLSETFEINNQLRVFNGKEKLAEIPSVSTEKDELTYEDKMLRTKFFLTDLAANFYIDDDVSKYDILHTYYQNSLFGCIRGIEVDSDKYYGRMMPNDYPAENAHAAATYSMLNIRYSAWNRRPEY
jgi:hypothetical protein